MLKKIWAVLLLGLLFSGLHAEIPVRKGWWKFDTPADLTKAEAGYGTSLTLSGSQTAASGPDAGNGAVTIGTGSYYKMYHGIPANGGGSYVNEYTLMFDVKIDAAGSWHSFFQTNTSNSNDADFFINTSGNIGVAAVGYSGYSVVPGQWYRLVLSVKNGDHFTGYLDGKPFLSGEIQEIDGRFSLENPLLIFADEDGEDGAITCAELAIWNKALDASQAAELGGYGHQVEPFLMTRIPFLQGPDPHNMVICWHDARPDGTRVEYGTDPELGTMITGTSEMIRDPFYWHTVRLTDLEADKKYYYRVGNGTDFSPVYAFRTLPEPESAGTLRFVLLSDTHSSDSTAVHQVMRGIQRKITSLYGPEPEKHVNGLIFSGDLVVNGSIPEQYTSQFLQPVSLLSPYIPSMTITGNHEGESPFYYAYMKLDSFSAFPKNAALNERFWSMRAGNTLFIGLNSNITGSYGVQEAAWLDNRLAEAEEDPTLDFVFLFTHHFPISELWNVYDESVSWVRNSLVPVLSGYSKVCELHYGHTHGYERGTLRPGLTGHDFRIVCGGGGGGALDPWNSPDNHDYNDIHISFSKHFFQVVEIRPADHSYTTTVYNVDEGNPDDGAVLDRMYRKTGQAAPDKPSVQNAQPAGDSVWFTLSPFSGPDSLMTVRFQVLREGSNQVLLDTMAHWTNVYGETGAGVPIDLHASVQLNHMGIPSSWFANTNCKIRIRYRDHNLKWSDWSDDFAFSATGITETGAAGTAVALFPNVPNPFSDHTTLSYYVPGPCKVKLEVADMNSRVVARLDQGMVAGGLHRYELADSRFAGGVYMVRLITSWGTVSQKVVKIR